MKKVLVGGVFDILHFGHIHFLKEAKKLGDYLVVAIESDANVKKLKGQSRPFHSQDQRKEILESLNFVNEVIILSESMKDGDYRKLVENVKPKVLAVTKGDPMIDKKKDHARTVLAKVVEIDKVDAPSTTQIAKLLELE
jgi:rfaE bifunctional protein nucleotidyltransferase chain/domain